MDRPLLIFDGSCGFCMRWVDRARKVTRHRVVYAPFQEAAARFPQIPRCAFDHAVQFIEPDGTHTSAAHAVFRLLTYGKGFAWLLFLYRYFPGFAPISEWVYRLIARHRTSGACAL